MKKHFQSLIIEKPRHLPYSASRLDNGSDKQAMRRYSNRKEFSDRLAPLRRFLQSNCGRLWSEVYSQVCKVTDARNIRGYHIRDHLLGYILEDYPIYSIPGFFYIDNKGILREVPKRSHKYIPQPEKYKKVENDRLFIKLRGNNQWFEFIQSEITVRGNFFKETVDGFEKTKSPTALYGILKATY